jgi:ABC-type nickel/cobalt efflux system permease component RcnA
MTLSGNGTAPVAALPDPAADRRRRIALALIAAVGALTAVALIGIMLGWAVGSPAAPPPRNPFGVGLREGGGSAGGLAGWILATQADFSRRLTAALRATRDDPAAATLLIGLGFAYGVFHAAGPGHGKAVIAAWIVAQANALRAGLAMAAAAALLQALVAIALVGLLAGLLNLTAARMTGVTRAVEIMSFAAVALLGAGLLWSKSRALAARLVPGEVRHDHPDGAPCGPGCGHAHLPPPTAASGWRSAAAAVLAAGMRPCSGAILVLVFSLSLGLFGIGVAAVLAMAAGTALTTGALAALAVLAKGTALRLASGRGETAALALVGLELVAAAAVLALGMALLAGMASTAAG